MPYREPRIVQSKTALKYHGGTVFHTYRHGLLEEGRMTYWFTLNPDDLEEVDHFDVRTLRAWNEVPPGEEDTRIRAALRRAIDTGEIEEVRNMELW